MLRNIIDSLKEQAVAIVVYALIGLGYASTLGKPTILAYLYYPFISAVIGFLIFSIVNRVRR